MQTNNFKCSVYTKQYHRFNYFRMNKSYKKQFILFCVSELKRYLYIHNFPPKKKRINEQLVFIYLIVRMNYLAHLYLSGNSEKLLVGNFIGDYVKGSQFKNYPQEISDGILLHREIDFFTDNHMRHREAKRYFRDDFGLYSGIVVDLIYDHFLAKNWRHYSDVSLRTFAKRSHAILLSNFRILPVRVQSFLPFLIQNKRLESYATIEGIVKSLSIMSRYTSLPPNWDKAEFVLRANYKPLEDNFSIFFAEVIERVCAHRGIEIKRPDFITGP